MEKYSYTAFAYVYDELMDNVPYDDWAEYLVGLLKENGVTDGLVCELGCGTGQMTRRLAAAGYDMIGIDLSEDMLDVAREQEYGMYEYDSAVEEDEAVPETEESGRTEERVEASETVEPSILYLQQDMRSFELYGTVSAVVSICDSMNYMTSDEDLLSVFRLVNNYLDRDGVFIFDMNTEYKYKELMGDTTIAENREECSFIWDNFYHEEERINEYDLTIFVKDKKNNNLFRRFTETHYQRGYTPEEMKSFVKKAGLEFVKAIDADTRKEPEETSERIYIIAREQGKTAV